MDGFTYGNLISLLSLVLSFAGLLIGVYVKLNARINKDREDSLARLQKNTEALAEYKLEVAEKYVSAASLQEFREERIRGETRMMSAIENLTQEVHRLARTG